MKKGISAVIATILMLLIAVALAGSAYMYASGMLTGRTAKTISVSDVSCNGTAITLVISNDGTVDIPDNDIKVLIDNADQSTGFAFNPSTIPPHTTAVAIHNLPYTSGTHTVLLTSPSNSARQTVYC